MNAFVFACDPVPERQINGMNHAFLPLEGRPMFLYVLMALDRVPEITTITVIGSPKEIMRAIERVIFEIPFQKKIAVLEQKKTLLENVFLVSALVNGATTLGNDSSTSTQADPHRKKESQEGLAMLPEPALFLPANIPFVTSAEISRFIAAADMTRSDFCFSIVRARLLTFSDSEPSPHVLYETEQGSYHPGRLVLTRPGQMADETSLKAIDALHHKNRQEDGLHQNGLKPFLKLIGIPDETTTDSRPSLSAIEEKATVFLKTQFKLIETVTGGNALPADDTVSYQFILRHFEAWRKHISTLKSEKGEKLCSISGAVCESHDTQFPLTPQ